MASIARFYALILSTVLLLSGVPGFFPNFHALQPLITFFALTLVHSVVHAAVGLLGLLITALASDESVRIYTIGIALLYGVLAAVGLAGFNFGPILYFNEADNWLHGAIFILSLGVFLAGVAEERTHRRKANILAGLPALGQEMPSSPGRHTGAPAFQPQSPRMSTPSGSSNAGGSSQVPWQGYPPEQQAQRAWPQSPWTPNQQPASQPQPQSQPGQPEMWPSSQPRDPWTREQRRTPTQRPMSSPAQGQQSENPWPQYPPPQSPWPASQQSQWPQGPTQGPPPESPWPQSAWSQNSQPSQDPWSQNPWLQEPPQEPPQNPWPQQQAREPRQESQPRDQWPLDEWPSLH